MKAVIQPSSGKQKVTSFITNRFLQHVKYKQEYCRMKMALDETCIQLRVPINFY